MNELIEIVVRIEWIFRVHLDFVRKGKIALETCEKVKNDSKEKYGVFFLRIREAGN